MSERLEALLDELARRHASGAELDLPSLFEQAGPDREAFAELADRLLASAPRHEPSERSLAYLRSLGEPPLLRVRVARKLRVAEVVERLATDLAVVDRPRLTRYYQRLEGGLLDPVPVDARVWDSLSALLGTAARRLAGPGQAELAGVTFYRERGRPAAPQSIDTSGSEVLASTAPAGPVPSAPALPRDPAPDERDELDRLFLGTG